MSIVKVDIENYKSIKKCSIKIKEINLFIGENGSGKSNVLSAIKFFYDNLLKQTDDTNIFDSNNKFNNCVKISITYDLTKLKIRSLYQLKANNSVYSSYFRKIVSMAKNDYLTITLIRIKDKKNNWGDFSLNERKMIYNLFPLYVVDSRNVDLTNWDELWQQIGDLTKLEKNLQDELSSNFKDIFEDNKYKLKNTFNKLDTAFSKSNIEIQNFSPKQLALTISKLYFNGNEFKFKDNSLNHFSNGTNALNYTCTLIEILKLIRQNKMKFPIILIDEPEISLHHKLIDELASKIFKSCDNITFFISTHSTRLLKDILRYDDENCCIYHISLINNYTHISNFRLFPTGGDIRYKKFIDDQNVNAYFAKTIVAFEGESEMDLFSNRYFLEVFPLLKEVEFLKATSNNTIEGIVSPTDRNYNTPYIFIKDMDKVIVKDGLKSKFVLKKEKNFIIDCPVAERYCYTNRRKAMFNLRKRIMKMAEKLTFCYELPFLACSDLYYENFIDCIKTYYKMHNRFIISTTLEGILITKNNLSKFYVYAKANIKDNQLEKMEELYNSFSLMNKLNFLRFLYNGKNEFLMKLENIKAIELTLEIKDFIQKNRKSKTSWVGSWIEYYFCDIVSLDPKDKKSFKKFYSIINDMKEKEKIKNRFKLDFEELHDLIEMVEEKHKKEAY